MQPLTYRRAMNRALAVLPKPLRTRLREMAHGLLHPSIGALPELRTFDGARLEPWKFGARAATCISADFELAWASQYVNLGLARDEGRRTRKFFPELLAALNRNAIPVTWAVVGHLFLGECRRDPMGRAHPELPHPRPYRNWRWSFERGDWYQYDPCSSVDAAPEWYASDLVDRILASEVRHEIGSHSFSHTDLSDANCPPEVAQGELRRCQEEASQKGIGLRSFVFPGNFEGNFAALRENGFIAYRGGDGVDLSYPEKAHGLWNIRESLQLFDPEVDYSRRLPLYVEAAIRAQVACHLSFHPSEPSAATVSGVLLPALAYLKSLEARGDIWIATMKELASYCEARSSALVREVSPLDWIVKWGHDPDRYPRAAITFSVPWAGSSPTCEVDDEEAAERGQSCFVRSGRLYMTITHPHSALRVRRV
ncbi:MAG TPA: polysaccharide deacetylase family protein [Thermoplasmata archaeon]|nr:polysaccharide deacetylase family protein [Thermoplasmata archaeon]